MKEFYHTCITAHSEVLLRNPEDVALMTNFSALAAYRSDTEMLTDSQMSTHQHNAVLTENPKQFVWKLELGLTKAFNHKHGRKGPLFDSGYFIQKIQGARHMQMAINYILRQGLHHGQSETAFSYPWSTCNYIFPSERGAFTPKPEYTTRQELKELLHHNADFPDSWVADENGILLRPSFEQIAMVENWYGTPRAYMYSMIRRTSEEWLADQQNDNCGGPPVTLRMLEKGFSPEDIEMMLKLEGNPKYVQRQMSDMDLCMLIDGQFLGRYHVNSVYSLTKKQKIAIANELKFDLHLACSEKQIARCLVMSYDR